MVNAERTQSAGDQVRRLREAWLARGWSGEMFDRAMALHLRRSRMTRWISDARWDAERVREALERRERMPRGRPLVRVATYADNDALAGLYADSPQDMGDREVTVERGPFAFAQFALQERAEVQVLELDGKLLAAVTHALPVVVVQGKETTAHMPSGWRVRRGYRGEGLGPEVQRAASKRFTGAEISMFYYRRHIGKKALRATVYCYPASPVAEDRGVRLACREDLATCARLINGTHAASDLFRPYDARAFEAKLDGRERESRASVYGWQDFYVAEESGDVVACGGLWDRGRHLREIWRHKAGGKQRVDARTALVDWGYAEGSEDAMAGLLGHFIGATAALGRDSLMAPLASAPALRERLERYGPSTDTRALYWHSSATLRKMGITTLKQPYIDLVYW